MERGDLVELVEETVSSGDRRRSWPAGTQMVFMATVDTLPAVISKGGYPSAEKVAVGPLAMVRTLSASRCRLLILATKLKVV
jgi:hypothetical protein